MINDRWKVVRAEQLAIWRF